MVGIGIDFPVIFFLYNIVYIHCLRGARGKDRIIFFHFFYQGLPRRLWRDWSNSCSERRPGMLGWGFRALGRDWWRTPFPGRENWSPGEHLGEARPGHRTRFARRPQAGHLPVRTAPALPQTIACRLQVRRRQQNERSLCICRSGSVDMKPENTALRFTLAKIYKRDISIQLLANGDHMCL